MELTKKGIIFVYTRPIFGPGLDLTHMVNLALSTIYQIRHRKEKKKSEKEEKGKEKERRKRYNVKTFFGWVDTSSVLKCESFRGFSSDLTFLSYPNASVTLMLRSFRKGPGRICRIRNLSEFRELTWIWESSL